MYREHQDRRKVVELRYEIIEENRKPHKLKSVEIFVRVEI
jgi:hypothetical protein